MSAAQNSRLTQILEGFAGQQILVVGDLMLDEFVWGRVERISPEAPVPVVEVQRESVHLGGAANVAANLAAMGAHPLPVGVVGCDGAAEKLCQELARQGISTEGLIRDGERITSVKTRIIAHHQQVCRTDRESKVPLSEALQKQLQEVCSREMAHTPSVILSDYSKGTLAAGFIQDLIGEARQAGKFVAVDPKPRNFACYRHASIVTPNKKEAESASGIEILDEASLLRAGRLLLESTSSSYLLITRGEEGMTLFEGEGHLHIPTAAREVFDVTGAGDTVIATLALAVAAGATVQEAALLANHAAGIVVGKLGTAAATVEEIRASVGL